MRNKIINVWAISAITWLALDYFSKHWSTSVDFEGFDIIPNLIYLVPFQKNDGIAFGIDANTMMLIAASIVILFLLIKYGLKEIMAMKKNQVLSAIFLGVTFGGGIGNLMDRIVQGYVIDFLIIEPFPVLNIADIGITVGLAALFVTMLLDQNLNKKS